jgi:enolase-phosphatase E1
LRRALDIEGTTTPMAFVHDVLFPFARTHLADWLDARSSSAEFNAFSSNSRARMPPIVARRQRHRWTPRR